MGNKRVGKAEVIEKVVLKNEDGKEEVFDKAMIINLNKLENGDSDMTMRFCNLNMEEIDNILYGLSLLIKNKEEE